MPQDSSKSQTKRWMPPISIGLSMPVREQASSQVRSVGHTRAQTAPSALLLRMVAAAPLKFLKRTLLMKLAGSVLAGHPFEQGASWQRRQRAASWATVTPV